jgi:hypothetical protein
MVPPTEATVSPVKLLEEKLCRKCAGLWYTRNGVPEPVHGDFIRDYDLCSCKCHEGQIGLRVTVETRSEATIDLNFWLHEYVKDQPQPFTRDDVEQDSFLEWVADCLAEGELNDGKGSGVYNLEQDTDEVDFGKIREEVWGAILSREFHDSGEPARVEPPTGMDPLF